MSEPKWRLLTGARGAATPELSAAEIAERLWTIGSELLWAQPIGSGEGLFPQEVPGVCRLLAAEPERVANAWLEYVPRPSWLHEWVMEVCASQPEDAWPMVTALVAVAKDDEALAMVAAGPLEELLKHQGAHVIERVEQQACQDGRFRRALSGVWRSSIGDEVWSRVQNAIGDQAGLDG